MVACRRTLSDGYRARHASLCVGLVKACARCERTPREPTRAWRVAVRNRSCNAETCKTVNFSVGLSHSLGSASASFQQHQFFLRDESLGASMTLHRAIQRMDIPPPSHAIKLAEGAAFVASERESGSGKLATGKAKTPRKPAGGGAA